MCWTYEDRRLQDEDEQREQEQLGRLEAEAEKRAEQTLSKKGKEAREPVRA